MPTYHYRCPNGHDFEKFERKITDQLRAKCPECGKMAERQISGGMGFHLKGSGFYATDYKAAPAKPDGGEKKPESTPDAKSESTSVAKPDAKPESKPRKDAE